MHGERSGAQDQPNPVPILEELRKLSKLDPKRAKGGYEDKPASGNGDSCSLRRADDEGGGRGKCTLDGNDELRG